VPLRRSLAVRVATCVATCVAIALLAMLGARDAGAAGNAPRTDDGLVVTLAADGSFLQVGKPVRVKISLENRGEKSVEIPNGALYGLGISVHPLDPGIVEWISVGDHAFPHGNVALPPGTTVTANVDLAVLRKDVFANPGRFEIIDEIAGAKSAPIEIEVARDWTGWHAVIETAAGEIELEFFPEKAPRTVSNFLSLAQRGFYDGLTFHRIVKDFMVQGGDPKGDGTGDSGAFLPFEKTGIKHERGVISMARGSDFNSASCQFFLVQRTAPFLDGNYAGFGRIVRGLEVLDQLAAVPCVMNPGGVDAAPSKPRERVQIQKIRPVAPDPGGH